MTENELITKIKEIQKITPRKDWVVFTKAKVLDSFNEKESSSTFIDSIRFIFSHKFVFFTLAVCLVFIGTISFAQQSVPGDKLFFIKRTIEESKGIFVSKEGKTNFKLEQAKKRLDDLTKVAESNKTKKLAPAMNAYKESMSDVASSLSKEENNEKVKEIVQEVQKLVEEEKKVKSLAVEIDRNVDLDYVLVKTIIDNINDLETKSLTETQVELLVKVNEFVKEGDFESALMKSLEINSVEEQF
ncbi:MAG: DUF5667 domain-containing protein [Candidatus Nealsonbacteria bacterium]